MIANSCGRLLHHLSHGSSATSLHIMMAADKVATKEARRLAFETSDVASDWVLANPDLALAWAEDRCRTIMHTSVRRRFLISYLLYNVRSTEFEHLAQHLVDKGKRWAAWAEVRARLLRVA